MSEAAIATTTRSNGSAAKAWVRALARTAKIARNPERVFPAVIQELGGEFGEEPALLSDRECLTYGALARRAAQYAQWALDQRLGGGETVCLLMPDRPEYMAIWLGVTMARGVVALPNTRLSGASLAHCINLVAPQHIIVAGELADRLTSALAKLETNPAIWMHGAGPSPLARIDREIERYGGEMPAGYRRPTLEDRALYIYTAGTTGLPKAAGLSHGRLMQWTHWFAGMMDTRPGDRLYDCLPMYHGVGGVQAPGAVLASGGSVVFGEKSPARGFWDEIVRWDCTLVQYAGELCRCLLQAGPSERETAHRIRLACGNGLRADVWEDFQSRFRIPEILEFYAATEGNVSLFNVEGEPGSIGRVPPHLTQRFPAALVKFDFEKEEPVRNERGFCVRCAPEETGEAIGRIPGDTGDFAGRFEGYTSAEASEKKILRNVFAPGDAWFRTGDLMRKNRKGFFYFVDRVGDTFRWKGEKVAASEVARAICEFPGIRHADVYGVEIPGADGRAGMAALATEGAFDLEAFRAHLVARLPDCARPLFLRIPAGPEVTSAFPYTKTDLARQHYNPAATADRVYFNDAEREAFVRLDDALYARIRTGGIDWRGRAMSAGRV